MVKRLQTTAGNGSRPGKTAAWLTCLSALVCAGALASDPSCGKRPRKNVIVADTPLTGPRADEGTTATFYVYAMDGWSRFYVRPAEPRFGGLGRLLPGVTAELPTRAGIDTHARAG